MHLCVALQEILGLSEPPHFLVPGYTATLDRWLDPRTQQLRTSAEIYPLVRPHQALLNAVFGTNNLVWQLASCQEELCDPIVLETYRAQFPQLWEDHDLIVRYKRAEQFSYSYQETYPSSQSKEVFFATILGENSGNEESTFSPLETTPSESSVFVEFDANASQELLPGESSDPASVSEAMEATRSLPEKLTTSPSDSQDMPPDSQSQPTQSYVLRLFVSGHSAATEYTLMSLHQLLEHSLRLPYTLKVIDVFKHPDQAEANQISATPTLLRVWPPPVRRIVGDLTDAERILRILAAPDS